MEKEVDVINVISGIERITPEKLIGPLNDVEQKFSPSYLFLKGNKDITGKYPRVSIIGTRNPSQEGIKNAIQITKSLVERGVVIVSGLAAGIDTIAHTTAIKEGGKTIAVIGTPLDKCYPKQNEELQDMIAKEHLLISEFEIGKPVTPRNFPMRNRTMALLSHASIIVEAGEKSGTRHQGWEALRLGRPLYIMEDVFRKADWADKMVRYGAQKIKASDIEIIMESLPALEVGNVTF